MAFSAPRGAAPDINVTPMIDVLLVLLIICMIITPVTPKGLDAAVPAPDTSPARSNPENSIVLQLSQGKRDRPALAINHHQVAWNELKVQLAEIYKQRADRVMFVQGDRDIDFSYVAEAIDIAHDSGVTRVGLMK